MHWHWEENRGRQVTSWIRNQNFESTSLNCFFFFFAFFFLPLPLLQSSSCNSLTFFAVSESVTKSGGCKDQPETCCVSVIDEHAVPSDVFSQNVLHFAASCLSCHFSVHANEEVFVPTCENYQLNNVTAAATKGTAGMGVKLTMHNYQTYQLTWW